MKAEDVTDTLERALTASGCDQAHVRRFRRMARCQEHDPCSRGALSSPNQGKTERWHHTLRNRVLLENYYLPGDLNAQIGHFIEHYNQHRYHEGLENLTPADGYLVRGWETR